MTLTIDFVKTLLLVLIFRWYVGIDDSTALICGDTSLVSRAFFIACDHFVSSAFAGYHSLTGNHTRLRSRNSKHRQHGWGGDDLGNPDAFLC